LLSDNGYVGTYVTLASAGNVTVSVNASGQAFGGVAPRMNIAVADSVASFDVAATTGTYQHTISLPAGTHFIRTDFNNDPEKSSRALTVANLNVSGATLTNANSDANALAAADTYIANSRRGPASLSLVGVEPGAQVHVSLKRHDFRFGTAVGGTSLNGVNSFLNNATYSNFLRGHFNTITQGNAGKWASNEATRDVVTMAAVDRMFQYAEQHGLDVRVHNMLWGDSQQPTWATNLLNTAVGADPVAAVAAKADLRTEISERIDYYVGDGDANPLDGDRARRYVEMDLLNEHDHQPKYWNAYGAAGIAEVFNEAASAVTAAGSNAKLYLNEYNVFQWGDAWGNWYREDVEAIQTAGGAIGGIGIPYYPSATTNGAAVHSPARMQQVLQGLSTTGLPITLSEFGVSTANGTTLEQAATYLTDTMRMTFGTPSATTFMMWGFATNDVWNQAPLAALMNTDGSLTSVGVAYEQLMSHWDTDVTLPVAADGTIDFMGFFGDYEVTVDGKSYPLSLAKGLTDYKLVVNLPGDFNNDGTVSGADLAVLRQRIEQGEADGGDFLLWQQQLGMSETAPVAIGFVVPAPEPGTAVLACWGAALLGMTRRKAQRLGAESKWRSVAPISAPNRFDICGESSPRASGRTG
jgi:GH35 family endo-1,4-beta-xylanase